MVGEIHFFKNLDFTRSLQVPLASDPTNRLGSSLKLHCISLAKIYHKYFNLLCQLQSTRARHSATPPLLPHKETFLAPQLPLNAPIRPIFEFDLHFFTPNNISTFQPPNLRTILRLSTVLNFIGLKSNFSVLQNPERYIRHYQFRIFPRPLSHLKFQITRE